MEAEIDKILGPRWLSRVVSTTLTGATPAELRLSFADKPKARDGLEAELFGKRVLFSDKDTAPVAAIVAAYRSQEADNYNPSYPFNAIDHLCVAVTVGDPTDPVR